jgi:hypothetical protein
VSHQQKDSCQSLFAGVEKLIDQVVLVPDVALHQFFLEIQPTVVSLLWRSCLFSILLSFSADGDDAVEFERATSEMVLQRQPWFYPRLVAYGYFWLSERA